MSQITAQETLPTAIAHHAVSTPSKFFLHEVGGRSQTYAEADATGDLFARAFHHVGVRRGDNVLVFLPTSIDVVNAWTALARLGAVHVPINTGFEGRMLEYVIENSKAKTLVCAARWIDRIEHIAERLTSLTTVIVLDGDDADLPFRVLGRDAFVGGADRSGEVELREPELSDPSMMMYTSGTTGQSKGVILPWGAFVRSSHNLVAPDYAVRDDDVMYLPFPLFHISGTQFLSIMARLGGTAVLREAFATDEFWSDVRRYACTASLMVGAMALFLSKLPPRDDDADNPLETVVVIPMIDQQEDFEKRFNIRTYTLYGSTELGCVLTSRLENSASPRSCGWPRPGFELRVVDERDRPVPDGEPGQLIVRPEEPWTTITEYFEMPEATAKAFTNLWFHTGDKFVRNERGEFVFFDRLKDSIRRRGENISSAELESFVLEHEAVLDCAAVAVPAELGEDEAKVCVVRKPGNELAAEELIDFLQTERIPRYMIPNFVEFLDELPRTPTNKVQKDVLRGRGITETTWERQR